MEPVYVVFIFVLFTYSVRAADAHFPNDLYDPDVTIRRNTRFTQNSETARELTLNSYINLSFKQCLRKCSTRSACKAVEYQVLTKYCSLRSAITAVQKVPGFMTAVGFKETVFQRRLDGSVDFYRNWTEYKTGFGDICGEFWLGLENMHTILVSSTSQFELRIDLEDWEGEKRYAVYDVFNLNGEEDGYRLQWEGYSGTAGNGLGDWHQIMQFTTFDKDNDNSNTNCAVTYNGAWWYRNCHLSNLNGYYYIGGHTADFATGAVWKPWKGYFYSYKTISMKMREKTIFFK